MFYLHSLIGLINSKKYWRVTKNLVPALKGVIPVKRYFYKILTKIQTKPEKKLDFQEILILEGYVYL